MSRDYQDQILALAGIFQAARLAQQLAREGRADSAAFPASIESVLRLDSPTTAAVYGGPRGVALGLGALRDSLAGGRPRPADVEMLRYAMALIQLERRLARRPQMLAGIRDGIASAIERMRFFENGDDGAHPMLVEKLAELYTQTISTLPPRIMVQGEHGHLATPAIAAKVRAALLAGIRSAVLWRQLGGRRWHLVFQRRRMLDAVQALLAG